MVALTTASVVNAQQLSTSISWPSVDIPYVRAWLQNDRAARLCWMSEGVGGKGFPSTVAGEKQCLAYVIQEAIDKWVNKYTESVDVEVATEAAKASAHKASATVTVK